MEAVKKMGTEVKDLSSSLTSMKKLTNDASFAAKGAKASADKALSRVDKLERKWPLKGSMGATVGVEPSEEGRKGKTVEGPTSMIPAKFVKMWRPLSRRSTRYYDPSFSPRHEWPNYSWRFASGTRIGSYTCGVIGWGYSFVDTRQRIHRSWKAFHPPSWITYAPWKLVMISIR